MEMGIQKVLWMGLLLWLIVCQIGQRLQQAVIVALGFMNGVSNSPHFPILSCFSQYSTIRIVHLLVIVFSVSPFVLTATLRKSYEVALMAVSQKWPVLLYGPVGAGKTALINKLARIGGNRGICLFMKIYASYSEDYPTDRV